MGFRIAGLIVIGAVMIGCSERPMPTGLDKIEGVTHIEKSGNALVVSVNESSGSLLSGFGSMASVIYDTHQYFPETLTEYSTLTFVVSTTLVDKYGNRSNDAIYSVSFPSAELGKLNYADKYGISSHLDGLASGFEPKNKVGLDSLAEYCSDQESLKYRLQFCKMALLHHGK